MSRILASDFGVWLTFKELSKASDSMLHSQQHRENLANYLLLYDQIVIPTGNLQILPVLRLLLGDGIFDELIKNREIVLARYNRWFAYAGNGGGIIFFSVEQNPNLPPGGPNLGKGYFKPLDEAVDIALKTTNPQKGAKRNAELRNLLLDHVIELPMDELQQELPDETYKDIMNSPYLMDLISLRNEGRSLNRLKGIKGDQLTIYSPHTDEAGTVPEIKAVLRVAFENFLLGIASYASASTLISDLSTLSVMKAKGQRFGRSLEGGDAFMQIQQVAGVPNLGSAFATGQISPLDVLSLRRSENGEAFRSWFGGMEDSATAEERVQLYREAVAKRGWLESVPVKLLRVATTSLAGLIEPVSGALASAVDSIMLEKWFPKTGPHLFLEETKTLFEAPSQNIPPAMRGRDRNKPCPCGSGKKFKNCHGRIPPQA